jgi:hypothetical protein
MEILDKFSRNRPPFWAPPGGGEYGRNPVQFEPNRILISITNTMPMAIKSLNSFMKKCSKLKIKSDGRRVWTHYDDFGVSLGCELLGVFIFPLSLSLLVF